MVRRKKRRRLKKRFYFFVLLLISIIFISVMYAIKHLGNNQSEASSNISQISGVISSSHSNNSSTISSKVTSSVSSSSTDDMSLILLVNKTHPLSRSYTPDLINIPKYYFNSTSKDNRLDRQAATYVEKMINDAKKEGIMLILTSAYRTYDYQETLFQNKVNEYKKEGYTSENAVSAAAQFVAPSGFSEHETGLAVDIISPGWYQTNTGLNTDFDQTESYQWLIANCSKYGFILRFLKGKEDITMCSYEPWHYRFVGTQNAEKIMKSGLCLEEYLEKN